MSDDYDSFPDPPEANESPEEYEARIQGEAWARGMKKLRMKQKQLDTVGGKTYNNPST